MTDYTKLVAAVRDTDFGDTCVYCEYSDMCKDADCIILQAADAIEALQAEVERLQVDVDAVLVVHGHWVTKTVRGDYVPCCSECGLGNGTLYEYDYCPNCGAKMDAQDGQE